MESEGSKIYESPEKKALKNLIKETGTTPVSNPSTGEETTGNPDYLAVQVCLDALLEVPAISELESKEPVTFTPIGFELIGHRVSNTVPLHERKSREYKEKVDDA